MPATANCFGHESSSTSWTTRRLALTVTVDGCRTEVTLEGHGTDQFLASCSLCRTGKNFPADDLWPANLVTFIDEHRHRVDSRRVSAQLLVATGRAPTSDGESRHRRTRNRQGSPGPRRTRLTRDRPAGRRR